MTHDRSEPSTVTGVLVSGGLDSCILVGHLLNVGHRVQPFYIRTGVSWERWELAAVRRFLQAVERSHLAALVTLELPLNDLYVSHWSFTGRDVPDAKSPDEAVYLPGRNALLLVKAAVWCQLHGIDDLALAPLGTSPFADASTEFVARFQEAMNYGATRPLRITLPFAALNKRKVMELGRRLPLEHTFSCIAPLDGRHCGVCNKCAERQQAFAVAEIPDPTDYAQATRNATPAGLSGR
jgi:7-cyano-7-deazaguanine synthase